jgi:rod shape-determining protein MreD
MVADKVAGQAGGSWRGLLLALLLALWLQSLPWRGVALALRPDFLLVLVLYASLYRPALAGMGWAFAIGLLSDFQEGVVFGQHATAYVSGVYVVQLLRLRLLMFDPLRQAIQLLPVFLLVQLVLLLIGWLAAAPPAGWAILLPVFSSAAVWYGLAMLMQLWHGKGARHD